MAVDIVTKNSATTTSEPAPGSLQQGELAANVTDGRLWVGNGAGDPQPLVGPNAPASSLPSSAVTGTPDGVKIVLGSTGTDANTLYFV